MSVKTSWTTAELLEADFPVEEEIYELSDPRDGRVHYVGRSIDVWQRWYQHQSNPQPGSMAEWIRDLKRHGLEPDLTVVCRCLQSDAPSVEMTHIKQRLQSGDVLFNTVGVGRGRPV
jgi:hypothetical protein